MDPIEAIKPAKDSTLAILLAAQARGWELFYAEQKDLYLRDGVAFGRLAPLKVLDDPKVWFTRGDAALGRLGDYDVILMRKDPPFDTEYIYSTYILDRAQIQGALVCNRPQGLRDMNEKVYTAWFPECCAPTLISRDMHDMSGCPMPRTTAETSRPGPGPRAVHSTTATGGCVPSSGLNSRPPE
jgi:glutathione synthase